MWRNYRITFFYICLLTSEEIKLFIVLEIVLHLTPDKSWSCSRNIGWIENVLAHSKPASTKVKNINFHFYCHDAGLCRKCIFIKINRNWSFLTHIQKTIFLVQLHKSFFLEIEMLVRNKTRNRMDDKAMSVIVNNLGFLMFHSIRQSLYVCMLITWKYVQ